MTNKIASASILAIGLLFLSPVIYPQTIETDGTSVEDGLLGGINKSRSKSTRKPSSSTNSASKKKKVKLKTYGPKIDNLSVDNVNLKLISCANFAGNLNCKGFINASDGSNFSLQCYSGSYLVADSREVGCQSVKISDIQNWSYVAVGLSPGENIPFEIIFSNASSSLASTINLVVSTPSQRNATLAFKNISLR